MADNWWERTVQYWYLPVENGKVTGEIKPIRMDNESYIEFKKKNYRIYDGFERAEYFLKKELA